MIKKLIDYIQSKVPISIVESNTTNSQYIKCNNKTIRISDHFGHPKDGIDIVVIIPETPKNFIVSIGYKVYCYTSFRKTGDFIVSYILIENNVSDKYETKLQNQSGEIYRLQKLVQDLQYLNKNLMNNNVASKESEYKKKCANQAATITSMNAKQAEQAKQITILQDKQIQLKEELKEKDAAIKEAVELIETLTTDPSARELLYSGKGKKYYLDNFPDDAREMIESIIKEYYDKTSG